MLLDQSQRNNSIVEQEACTKAQHTNLPRGVVEGKMTRSWWPLLAVGYALPGLTWSYSDLSCLTRKDSW